jgi:hypothetical protein
MKKKLYSNGIFVCDFEATGDDKVDAATCQKLLEEMGIAIKLTPIQAIFRQAYSFCKVAAKLYGEMNASPTNGIFAIPFVVNATFSIELYLKTLGHIYGADLKGHNLVELLDRLPEAACASINDAAPAAASKWKIEEKIDMRACLSELQNAFVEWRYLHERENTNELNIPQMIFVSEALHVACVKSGKT